MEVLMKHIMAILILLILMAGCAPSGNNAASAPVTPVTGVNQGSQVQPASTDSAAQARISSLESDLAACQSLNAKLQKQIDQSAAAANMPSSKAPVAGDAGFYSMKFDRPGLLYPNKYLVWDITGLDCGAFERCTLKSALTNNHPTLAMTNVTINDESVGSAGTSARINPGETFINTKNLPMTKVVDYQVTLRWMWQ
jgi:hypothetical protein